MILIYVRGDKRVFVLLQKSLSIVLFFAAFTYLSSCGIKGKPLPPLESPQQEAQATDTKKTNLASMSSTDKTTSKKTNKK